MKRRLYYYGEDVLSKSFLILPKELVFTKSLANMSAKSKILYCVLRERLMLSARNNWTDENGRIYIIYSIEKIVDVPLFPLCGVFSMAIKKVDCLWNRAVIICVVSATGIFYRKSIAIADVPVGMNYATIYRD